MKSSLLVTLTSLLWVGVFAGCDGHSHSGGGLESHHGEHGHEDEHAHGHGFGHESGHESGHGHDHGPDAIGITRWTDTLELFAEYPPAVTGEELALLAHLTVLDGFEALDDASAELVLDGPTRIDVGTAEKLRPGIFRFTFIAPAAGTYNGALSVSGSAVNDTVDGFELVVFPSVDAARQRTQNEAAGEAEAISFLKEQQWQVPFATTFAAIETLIPTIEVAGEVTTPPGGQADVGAAIAGRVVVATHAGLPRPGQAVQRGELLATIAPAPAAPEAGAQAELAVVEATARMQAARAAVERAERLILDRAISQRAVDEARRELQVAQEAVQTARKARAVFSGATSGRGGGSYRVTAPIAGIVVEVEATAGKPVKVGDPLFRVVNLDELWIRARVPEQQAAIIAADQDAAYKLPGLDAWVSLDVTDATEVVGERAAASVIDVGRVVDRRSRTVDVIYALSKPDPRLRVGAMLRVAIPAGQPWEGVVVPRDAVLDAEGGSIVYVQVEGESFEERGVRVGPRSGARVGIVSGVKGGERVVSLGANVIRLSSRARTAPAHGHVH